MTVGIGLTCGGFLDGGDVDGPAGAVVAVGVGDFFGLGVGVGEAGTDVAVGGTLVAVGGTGVRVGVGVIVGVFVGGRGGVPTNVGMIEGGGGGVAAAADTCDEGDRNDPLTTIIPMVTGSARARIKRLFIQDSLRLGLRSGRLVAAYKSVIPRLHYRYA